MTVCNHNDDNFNDSNEDAPVTDNIDAATYTIRDMSMSTFRRRVVKNFTVLWENREVVWPSRTGTVEWTIQQNM
jgi:hypothetical protein